MESKKPEKYESSLLKIQATNKKFLKAGAVGVVLLFGIFIYQLFAPKAAKKEARKVSSLIPPTPTPAAVVEVVDPEELMQLLRSARKSSVGKAPPSFVPALEAYESGDFAKARAHILININSRQNLALAYNLLGVMFLEEKKYEEAIVEFKRSLKVNETSDYVLYNAGDVLRRLNRPMEALPYLEKAVRRDPTSDFWRFRLILTQIDLGDTEKLEYDTERTIRLLTPDVPTLMTAAALALKKSKFKEAATLMARAKPLTEPKTFQDFLDDLYFQKYRNQPLLAPFFVPPVASPVPTPTPTPTPLLTPE